MTTIKVNALEKLVTDKFVKTTTKKHNKARARQSQSTVMAYTCDTMCRMFEERAEL